MANTDKSQKKCGSKCGICAYCLSRETRDDLGFRPPLTHAEREAMDHRAMARGRGQFPDDDEEGAFVGSSAMCSRCTSTRDVLDRGLCVSCLEKLLPGPGQVFVPPSQTAAAIQGFRVRPRARNVLGLLAERATAAAYNNPWGFVPTYPPGAWRVGRR